MVQGLRLCASNAGGTSLIPGQETKSHMITHGTTWCSQINKKSYYKILSVVPVLYSISLKLIYHIHSSLCLLIPYLYLVPFFFSLSSHFWEPPGEHLWSWLPPYYSASPLMLKQYSLQSWQESLTLCLCFTPSLDPKMVWMPWIS